MVVTTEGKIKEKPITSSIFERIYAFFTNRMVVYITRRLLTMIPLFLGIAILTFAMVRAIGDPTDLAIARGPQADVVKQQLTELYGLNQPVHVQFLKWMTGFFTGDWIYSSYYQITNPWPRVKTLIGLTAALQYPALIMAVIISVPLGVMAAKKHETKLDTFISAIALLGVSLPIYVTGIMLILVFGGSGLDLFPVRGAYTAFREEADLSQLFSNFDYQSELLWANLLDSLHHMVLPLTALTFVQLATTTRLLRSSMLEVLREDYVLAARANGLSEREVTWKHAFRNAIIPVVTFLGIALGTALGGAPITETVFTYPGLGLIYIRAIFLLDMSLILGITALITILILLSNLLTDIVYVYIDPRIKL